MSADRPALADRTVGNLIAKVVRELATAPDLAVEDGRGKDEVVCAFCHGSSASVNEKGEAPLRPAP